MRPKPKQFLLPAIIFLAIVLVALAVRLWPRTVPFDQCSDVYKHYADMDGIDATYIKGYKVNDSIFVDVTLIEATTDSAWNSLLKDFNIIPPPLEVIEITGEDCIDIWAAPKKDYSMPMDSLPLNNDLIAMSWTERRISVFSIETTQQLRSLKRNQFKESISKSQNLKSQTK